METKEKSQKGNRQNLRINAFCSWNILTVGPPRLTMSGSHFSYSFFSLFALLCLCFFCFVLFLPVLHVVSLWLCIQLIWPVAHTHTKGKLNTWVPLLYIHLSLARIVFCSCQFIPLPALSIEDPFQVTNVTESIFMACWIDAGVRLCRLFLGFDSEELCNDGNSVWIKSEPARAKVLGFFPDIWIILINIRWTICGIWLLFITVPLLASVGHDSSMQLQIWPCFALFGGRKLTARVQRETPGLHFWVAWKCHHSHGGVTLCSGETSNPRLQRQS